MKKTKEEKEVLRRLFAANKRAKKLHLPKSIEFNKLPVCVVFFGDQHLGNKNTDTLRCFTEAMTARKTPGVYIATVGDMLDNFIVGKLLRLRTETTISIPDEWVAVKYYLKIISKRLIFSVSGNHELWTHSLTGIDYFGEQLKQIAPDTMYDTSELLVNIAFGGHKIATKIRHKWQGSSIYNPTHGIERASKWDSDFDIGVAGHTHTCGVAREFNNSGKTGISILVGSYKRNDDYYRQGGFPKPNEATGVALVLGKNGNKFATSNLNMAFDYMRLSHR